MSVSSTAARECTGQGPTASTWSSSSRRLQLDDDETPEVVNLRRLIAEQKATFDERRRRIEATEQQIEEYERCVHDARCAQDGGDYVQRAYSMAWSDDDDDEEDLARGRRPQTVTDDTIAGYYRQASDDIRHHLIAVEAELVDVANNIERIASAADGTEDSGQVDELDVDRRVQMTINGSTLQCRRACQLDALRLELSRADDTHRQQLVQQHRLSSAVADAQSQLNHEELRLVAMLSACDQSPHALADVRKLPRPLNAKTNGLRSVEDRRHVEKDRQITGRSDPDGQAPVSAAVILASSTSAVTRSVGCRENSHHDSNNTANCKTHEVCDGCSDMFASDSVSDDAGFGSLPSDEDDPFIDSHRHRLVTLV